MLTRASIMLLLVLNLGVAAWWLLHSEPASTVSAQPAGGPRLQLLAEASADRVAALAPARPAIAAPAPAPTPARVAPAVVAAIPDASDASDPSQCTGPEGTTSRWRVYLPRLPTLDAAQAMATRIGAAGFSDYLVMRDGDEANAIALGSYGTRDAAQRRVASLHAAGFPARCARIPASTPA